MTKEPVEALKPQLDLIPENSMKDLKRLSELTGHNLESVIAGWWIRFSEVQTLQIELEYQNNLAEYLNTENNLLIGELEQLKMMLTQCQAEFISMKKMY